MITKWRVTGHFTRVSQRGCVRYKVKRVIRNHPFQSACYMDVSPETLHLSKTKKHEELFRRKLWHGWLGRLKIGSAIKDRQENKVMEQCVWKLWSMAMPQTYSNPKCSETGRWKTKEEHNVAKSEGPLGLLNRFLVVFVCSNTSHAFDWFMGNLNGQDMLVYLQYRVSWRFS